MEQLKNKILNSGILSHKEIFIILAIVGIILCAIPITQGKEKEKETGKEEIVETSTNVKSEYNITYCEECEKVLTDILLGTQGIGKVVVTVTMSPEDSYQMEGVVVIAEHGDQDDIRKDITEIVQALFDIEAHKIKVVKMKLL